MFQSPSNRGVQCFPCRFCVARPNTLRFSPLLIGAFNVSPRRYRRNAGPWRFSPLLIGAFNVSFAKTDGGAAKSCFSPLLIGAFNVSGSNGIFNNLLVLFQSPSNRGVQCFVWAEIDKQVRSGFQSPSNRGVQCFLAGALPLAVNVLRFSPLLIGAFNVS